MPRASTYAAIDIGTTKICTLVGLVGQGGDVEVIGVGVAPSRGLLKGMVVNIDEAAEAIRISIERAERSSSTRVTSAHVGITGSHLTCLNNRGMITITRTDRLVSPEDVSRVLEAAQMVSIPNNREIVHVIPRGYILDGQEGVRNPVGLHGFRLDVEAHIVTGAITSIQNLTKCVQQVGVEVDNLVLEPLASSEAVLTDDERETGVVLIDIGGGTTDLAMFSEGSIRHTGALPIGGYQFTNDLVIGLRTPYAGAEAAKITHGCVDPAAISLEDMVEVDSFGDGGRRQVSRKLMSEILRARAEELLDLVRDEVRRSGHESMYPAGAVLTGGSASLTGLPALAEQVLKMPVRVGSPDGAYGLMDTISGPAYATSVGLLLWAARYTGEAGGGGEQAGFLQDLLDGLLAWFKARVR